MIEFTEACELILENVSPQGTAARLIEDSIGWVLADDVISPISVAPFRNSAMDGFAVKSQWLEECSVDSPRVIPIGSTSFAGRPASDYAADSHTLKVMTGARVPDEFDAVVPFEDTGYDDDKARFIRPAVSGQHIRPAGEDIARGQKLFEAGSVLSRLDIGILATIGLREVITFRKPSLIIIGTGDELTNPGEELAADRIYDANTFTILSLVGAYCDKVERICNVPDNEEELQKALDSPHDVIVTSGSVSAGERDLLIGIAESCGWRRVFHKVRIKPGKPAYFAVRGKQLLFGLPGNPLSAAVTCCVFLIPALKKLAGFTEYRLRQRPAAMPPKERRKSDRKLIWPGFIKEEAGRTTARFSPKTSSGALTALLGTDGLIIQDTMGDGSEDAAVGVIPWGEILKP